MYIVPKLVHAEYTVLELVYAEYVYIVLKLVPYSRESPPMGAASYFLTKQGGGRSFECFRIQPRKSAHLCLRTQVAIAAIEQQARVSQSPPSTSTSLESLATSPLTTSSSVFAAAKSWLRSSVEAAGPSSAQASQATHMDTIDTDTQTNRDLLQGGSYLRYAH